MALGILLEGAQGDERKELYKVLHLDDYANKDSVHQRFHELLDEFRDMSTRAENKRNASVEIANLALIKEGLNVPSTFLDAVRKDYEANIDYENFATNGEAIRLKINKFVEERTHGLIK
ncbi:leukocyte elastase inhibitor-like isoform X2, partial [Leptotrombidium deliense]